MSGDTPERRRRQQRLFSVVLPVEVTSWFENIRALERKRAQLMILAWKQYPYESHDFDWTLFPVRTSKITLERTLPYSRPPISRALANTYSRCRDLSGVLVLALSVDLGGINSQLRDTTENLIVGMEVSGIIQRSLGMRRARVKLSNDNEATMTWPSSEPFFPADFPDGASVKCRVLSLPTNGNKMIVVPADLPMEHFLDQLRTQLEWSFLSLTEASKLQAADLTAAKVITASSEPPWNHALIAMLLPGPELAAIQRCAQAISRLPGVDDKCVQSCLDWLMKKAVIPDQSSATQTLQLPPVAEASVAAVHECIATIQDSAREFKQSLAAKIQAAVRRLSIVAVPEIKAGRSIAVALNDCLDEYGFRFALNDHPEIPGTLEYYKTATDTEPYFVVRRRASGVSERPKIGLDFSQLLVIFAPPDGRRSR